MTRNVVIGCVIFFLGLFILIERSNIFEPAGMASAMTQYLRAIREGDTSALIDLLPNERKFRFSSYSGVTGNLIATEQYTKNQAIGNLAERSGLYFALFSGTDQYRYRDRAVAAPLSSWSRVLNVFRWQEGKYKSYVKWDKEGDEWKITEIGDMVP